MPFSHPGVEEPGRAHVAFTDTSGWSRVEQGQYEDMLIFGGPRHMARSVVATLTVMDVSEWSVHRQEPETGTIVGREAWEHGGENSVVPLCHGVLTTRSLAGEFGDLVLRTWSFQAGDLVTRVDCICPVEWYPALTPSMDSLVAGLQWGDGRSEVTEPDEAPTATPVPAFALPNASSLSHATAETLFDLGRQGTSQRYLGSSVATELVDAGLFRSDGQPTAMTETFIDVGGEAEYGMEVAALSGGRVRTLRLRFRGKWAAALHHEQGSPESAVALLRRTQAPDVMARWSGLHPVRSQQASPVDVAKEPFQRRLADANEPRPSGADDGLTATLWNAQWRVVRTQWIDGVEGGPPTSAAARSHYSAVLMAGDAGCYRFGTVGRLATIVRLGPLPPSEVFRQWVLDVGGFRMAGMAVTAP